MSQTVNLVAVQMTSMPEPQANMAWLEEALQQAALAANSIVVLPECFACFGAGDRAQYSIRESVAGGPLAQQLFALAAKFKVHLFAGTMPLVANSEEKFAAGCRYIDPNGEQRAVYRKIHLFDVQVADATGSYRESAMTAPGDQVVVVDVNGLSVGIAVCYDVRFTGLFDAMGDIDVLVLPSAFTQKTGEAHWEVLLRARAIEKQCFVVAANQGGEHANGRQTYGHSMIISPWGEILTSKQHGTGCIQAAVDIAKRAKIKQAMPVQSHSKFRSYFVK